MASQPLAFAEILIGGVLVYSAISKKSLKEVLEESATKKETKSSEAEKRVGEIVGEHATGTHETLPRLEKEFEQAVGHKLTKKEKEEAAKAKTF
jgi:hypothetical protein